MNKLKITILFISLSLLGCAGMNGDFTCNNKVSDTCMTMEQANNKAKEKAIETSETNRKEYITKVKTETVNPELAELPEFINISLNNKLNNKFPHYRSSEQTAKILILPYVDENNNLHQSVYISFITSKPTWKIVNQ